MDFNTPLKPPQSNSQVTIIKLLKAIRRGSDRPVEKLRPGKFIVLIEMILTKSVEIENISADNWVIVRVGAR